MAIALDIQPEAGELYAAYASQVFVLSTSVEADRPPAALEVIVRNNGVAIETLYYEAVEIDAGSSFNVCRFKLDIKEVVQGLFNPASMLPETFGINGVNLFASETAIITCDFTAWLPNADGLLIRDDGNTEVSLSYMAINAVRYENESASLDAYVSATDRKFLTSKPLVGWTELGASEFLYCFNPSGYAWNWIFEFFTPDGTQLSLCRVSQTGTSNKIVRKGVGGKNVANTSFTIIVESGLGGGLISSVGYYEVYASVNTDGSTAMTHRRRYYVDRSPACVEYRLHFLNRFGVWDYLPILSQKANTLKTFGDPYEAAVADDFTESSVKAHQRNRGQVRADKGFEVEVRGVFDNTALWLRELALSPMVFIEERQAGASPSVNGLRYPVVVRDGEYFISERRFEFSVFYSTQLYSQRT